MKSKQKQNFESTDLPSLKPRTHCVLIPRDPNIVYAYWNYSEEDLNRALNGHKAGDGNSKLILRVYDITLVKFNGLNANNTWDLEVGFSIKNWYIHVWQDNADYCAELGISHSENDFIPLTRSNIARTPPKTASVRNDLIWQDIKAHKETQPYIQENIQGPSPKSHKAGKSQSPRVYKLTARDIRNYYMKLFAGVTPRGKIRAQIFSIENILKGQLGRLSWQKVQPVLRDPDLLKQMHQGASKGLLENKGASENLFNIQSGASEGRLNNRKFFFEIWAELIVHGRTEPDATVSLNKKEIKLNPDGTFTLRYSLPDGKIPLGFIAQSSDGFEQRQITTQVDREKTIGSTKMLKGPHG